jgi:hypothetical protein
VFELEVNALSTVEFEGVDSPLWYGLSTQRARAIDERVVAQR